MIARWCGLAVLLLAACASPASSPAAVRASPTGTEAPTASIGSASAGALATAARTPVTTATAAAPTRTVAPGSPSTGGVGAVTGQIVWGTTPVAGIAIEVKLGDLFGSGSRPVAATATSDGQGRYRAAGLTPGQYTVFAIRTGTPYVGSTIPTIDIAAGADTSAPAIYMTKTMGLVSPAQEASLAAPVTFTWEQVPGTTRYELFITEIANACTYPPAGLAPRPTYATSTSTTVDTLVAGKHYTWTVKATIEGGDLAWYTGTPRCIWVK